ncbi:MAG: hypothetical protein AAGK32_01315, partial [Actinomycetota bacterium]
MWGTLWVVSSRGPARIARGTNSARSVGLVVAEAVRSAATIPPFDNSAMDGFALQAHDTSGADATPVVLDVAGTVA